MKSAIITGGTSFIGRYLVAKLLRQGIDCYAVVRPESRNAFALPQDDLRLHLIHGSASEPDQWIKNLPACDTFYHFAWDGIGAEGRASPEIQKKNIQMTMDCLRTAAEAGCARFVFAGSQAEYGICDDLITEGTECHPIIEYGKAKLEVLHQAEKLSRDLGIEYVHLRIFSVYGPGDHPWTLVSRCLEAFGEGKKMILSSCTQSWNFLYVTDAAEAIALFFDCPTDENPIYNIAGEETRVLREYIEIMRDLCGGGIPIFGQLQNSMEQPHGIHPDIQRMQAATGWKMKIGFATGIRKIMEVQGI